VNRIVGGYRLVELLGTGFSGAVYRANRVNDQASGDPPWDISALPATVAIKVFLPPENLTAATLEEFRRRFLREANVFQGKRNSRIVPVLASGEDYAIDHLCLVMPYMPGGTLATALKKQRGGLPLKNITQTLSQVAEALDFAHSKGIIHRDIKPANILFDDAGDAYLADFSIMRQEDVFTTVTSTGAILGTYAYMAPEQARDPKKVGPESDIYGLGCVLYEMVTGRLPFQATSVAQMLDDHARKDPEPPHSLRRDLTAQAESAIYKALAKNPQGRFHHAGQLAHAFSAGMKGQWSEGLTPTTTTLTDGDPATVAPFTPARTVVTPRSRRYSILLAVALLLLVGLLAIIARTGFPPVGLSTIGRNNDPTVTSSVAAAQQTIGTSPSTPTPTTQPGPAPTKKPTVSPTSTFTPAPTNTPVPQPVLAVTVEPCAVAQQAPGGSPWPLSAALRAFVPTGPSGGTGGADYQVLTISNTGAATLEWTGSTSDNVNYPLTPPFGSLSPNASQTAGASGPWPAPSTITVQINSNGGSWQGPISLC
jgi:serine/threonine-protein kinase